MVWNDANQQQPKPFARVWIKTSDGRQTTGHVNSSGKWLIHCPRIAAANPSVIAWRE